ncbi:MAG: CoA-transferase [Nocardioides sp.]|uniref:CoA-transferase n=1 Tax=Nocardioides sp. TaxID=35761 RepID=UPI0039E6B0A8
MFRPAKPMHDAAVPALGRMPTGGRRTANPAGTPERGLASLLTTLRAAVASVEIGEKIYLGNFGSQLFSVGHEMLRQRCSGLHLIMGSGSILLDQLIAGGVTDEITISHCWNPIGPAPAHHFVSAVQRGIRINELSLGAFAAGLTAGAWDVPFLPTSDLTRTDYVAGDRSSGLLGEVKSPWGSCSVVAAIRPDLAFVHVDRATTEGNAVLAQPASDALAAAQAARRLVLVAEEIVDRLPGPADVPGAIVDAVVHHPRAVHPDGCPGRYPRDVSAYQEYAHVCTDSIAAAAWRPATTPPAAGATA